jgi:predicted secreted Zn-dependent protease
MLAGGLATSAVAMPAAPARTADPFAGIPNLSFRYYDVPGTTSAQINAVLAKGGPHGAGSTDYRITYHWGHQRTGSRCSVVNVRVSFAAIIRLPRPANEAILSEPVLLGWRTLDRTLRQHEAGHARIAYDHRNLVRTAVAAAPCGQEEARGERALSRILRLQRNYDRRTQHGLAQGNITR